jgi:hypothetical protein
VKRLCAEPTFLFAALTAAVLGSASAQNAEPLKFTPQQLRYWAFQPVVKPAVPRAARNPADAFLLAALEARKLRPNPPADKVTLIRRATLDLTGLPPAPEEVQAFVSDGSAQAFEKVVDRLLASPRYGELWGRHWLDLARYADTDGFKEDEVRPHIWRYRDYVIQSFNEDKPYDRFIREQIAGDELYPGTSVGKVAVGFNRHFPDENGAQMVQARRQETLNDITDTVGAVFLGLTYGCARCHDHKFDPILHKDYYRLQAFFANVRVEDHAMLAGDDERRAYEQKYAEWEAQTRDARSGIDKLLEPVRNERMKDALARMSPEAREACLKPPEQRSPMERLMYLIAKPQISFDDKFLARRLKGEQVKQYESLSAELKKFDGVKPVEPPVAQSIVDNGREAPPTHVLAVGNWDSPKEQVEPGFLSILAPGAATIVAPENLNSSGRRSALANWLADTNNPLTARVLMNRLWHYHFGRGIVGTPSDFGVMGERPTNQKLLDYLAATFVENGWSIKKIHRLIMLSDAYQRSSSFQAEAAQADPDNKLLWRYNRHRLEGEAIRDSMLFASGKLNLKMGGPGVHPPLPAGTTTPRFGSWKVEQDDEINRRSVYVFVKRNLIYPLFAAFDGPNAQETCARRFRTVNPAQSLTMMNDDLVTQWARALADRVLDDKGLTPQQQLGRAYRIVFSRPPTADESREVMAFLDRQTKQIADRLADRDQARVAAFASLCQVLMNSNEFLYIN